MITVKEFLKNTNFELIGYEGNNKYYSIDLDDSSDCRANELENINSFNFNIIKFKNIFDLTKLEKLEIGSVIFCSDKEKFGNEIISKLESYILICKRN